MAVRTAREGKLTAEKGETAHLGRPIDWVLFSRESEKKLRPDRLELGGSIEIKRCAKGSGYF